MNITVTDQEHCKKQVRLVIPGDTVRAETDRIAAEFARRVNVPGFRRGHVPKSVVKTRFRKELRDEMLAQVLPDSLKQAILEKDLKIIGEPSFDGLEFGDDESIDVTFHVDVAPEFSISNYKELPLTKRVYKIRDEDVESAVERLRLAHAELVPVEDRPSQAGDIVTANLAGKKTAEEGASEEAQAEEINKQDVEIEIGGPGVLKEFSEALTGVRAGDQRAFTVVYPEVYQPERLAGQRYGYTAEVTAVREKELPEVDDEFAHSVSEEFTSADQLRADIRSKLEREAAQKSEGEFKSSVMEKLVDRNRFDVPAVVVEGQIDSRMKSMLRQMTGGGMDPRQLKVDWEAIRDLQRERAEREVRGSFLLQRIAETEKIEVSEQELSGEIEKFAESIGQTAEALRARLTKENALASIEEQVRHRKALDFVIASAEIRTEEIEGLGADGPAAEGGQADQ